MPEQCELPATACTCAVDNDSDCNSTQSSEPGVEPEDREHEDWDDDLGVAALDKEVHQLPEGEIDSELVVTTGNSTNSTSKLKCKLLTATSTAPARDCWKLSKMLATPLFFIQISSELN